MTDRGYWIGVTAGLSLLGLAGASNAQDKPADKATEPDPVSMPPGSTGPQIEVHFEQLDRNSDGLISRSEAKANPAIDNTFKQLDRNNDGNLSPAEFSMQTGTAEPPALTPRAEVNGANFQKLDADSDGQLSPGEAGIDGSLNARFAQLDANSDGQLSLPEYISSFELRSDTPVIPAASSQGVATAP